MDFLNDPVLPESLPRAEEARLTPLAPDYRKVLRLEWGIFMLLFLLIIVALIVFIPPLQKLWWISGAGAGWLLLAAAWFALMEKSFAKKGYAIRDKDVIYRSGWLIQTTHTCPFNRIQHSTVTMGPLERKFGLARLVLYTAGSNDADMRIPGLTDDAAQSLKEWITKKIADEPTGQL
jgi:membrane protein YdbS with pleckstrin-like domain